MAESFDIRLLSSGYISVDSWWTTTDTLRDFWRLYLNEQDGAALDLGSECVPLPRDRVVLVPAGLQFAARLDRPVQQLFVHFELVGWPAAALLDVVPAPVRIAPEPLLHDLARKLAGELSTAEALDPILGGKLKAFVHLAISRALGAIPEIRARRLLQGVEARHQLRAVFQYIDDHLDRPMRNAKLAELARASESRFIQSFRETTGRTPARYVQDRRVRRAAELLLATRHTIDEIAERCGFANRYYFTRVFTNRMGCPPARYRSDRPFLIDGDRA